MSKALVAIAFLVVAAVALIIRNNA